MSAARIIAVDLRPEALELAEEHGADLTFISGENTAEEVRKATPSGRGADVVLDFVGADATLAMGAAMARQMGDLTIVGIGGGSLPVSFFSVPYEVSIQTTYWGSRPELAEVLDLGARGLIGSEISTYSLDDASQAYQDLKDGKIAGRAVVVPNP